MAMWFDVVPRMDLPAGVHACDAYGITKGVVAGASAYGFSVYVAAPHAQEQYEYWGSELADLFPALDISLTFGWALRELRRLAPERYEANGGPELLVAWMEGREGDTERLTLAMELAEALGGSDAD